MKSYKEMALQAIKETEALLDEAINDASNEQVSENLDEHVDNSRLNLGQLMAAGLTRAKVAP